MHNLPFFRLKTRKHIQPTGKKTNCSSSIPNSVPPDANQSQASHRDLAYASLVDGNVLHPCFGLRASANGRPNDSILGKTQKSSIFCCFPSQSLVDTLLAPRLSRNRLEFKT